MNLSSHSYKFVSSTLLSGCLDNSPFDKCCDKMLNCRDNFLLSSRGSSQFFRDKSLNVTTFLLPFAFCFVVTIVEMS